MNQELEKLIDFALADGVLTDKEKEILNKKAKELNVDMDEFEMVLNAKVHLKQKEMQTAPPPPTPPQQQSQEKATQKEGDLKKCPSCGAPVQSFTSNCKDCGHEFRNINSNKALSELFEHLKKFPINQHSSLISNFPIPNSKEDLIEFIILCINNSTPLSKMQATTLKQTGGMLGLLNGKNKLGEQREILRAWANKGQNAIDKAKLLLANDSGQKSNLETWAKQLAKNANSDKNETRKKLIILVPIFIVLLVTLLFFAGNQNTEYKEGVKKEKARLENIVNIINVAVSKNDFQTASIQVAQLKWEYSDGVIRNEIKQLEKSWDEKREELTKTINELKSKK